MDAFVLERYGGGQGKCGHHDGFSGGTGHEGVAGRLTRRAEPCDASPTTRTPADEHHIRVNANVCDDDPTASSRNDLTQGVRV